MKLSRSVEYAIKAAVELARTDTVTPLPAHKIAAAIKMPERFLIQVLRRLTARGITDSILGSQGGYALGRRPKDVTLLEIFEAIEGPLDGRLLSDTSLPDEMAGQVREAVVAASEAARSELRRVTLADLAGPNNVSSTT